METPASHGKAGEKTESIAGWLGINRATLAVLIVIGGLGLSEEIWRNFLAIQLKDSVTGVNQAAQVLNAAKYMGIFAVLVNFLEGFGYIIGGRVAHRLGPRVALLISALPMLIGFTLLLSVKEPWLIIRRVLAESVAGFRPGDLGLSGPIFSAPSHEAQGSCKTGCCT
ncbi:MAG: hypothetical protein NTY16_04035 [Deltaproteobacteria bacterium]|nr:hypothetical protein [Deltaproteobacteria bacterium]